MKRRFIGLMFLTFMLIGAMPLLASAAGGECGDNLTWVLENGTLTISGSGQMYDYAYPETGPWCSAGEDVKNVLINDGVENIGMRAFYQCETLETVVLADSVTKIGGAAFYYCGDSFTSITIPKNVNDIEQSALSGNDKLTIKAYEGTYAHDFALDNGITFESLGEVPTDTINVSTAGELLDAIGSNREIVLADGVYMLDSAISIGSFNSPINNLTIRAENPGKAEILSRDGYNPVVRINSSNDISIDGLILGHESIIYQGGCGSTSYSSAYVLQANNSDTVTVTNCDLYGCGTVALVISYTDNFTAENCILRDCEESIASLIGENLQIKNCIISGNAYNTEFAQSEPAVYASDYPAAFIGCSFYNNNSAVFSNDSEGAGLVTTDNCTFQDNAWQEGETPEYYGVCLNGITWQVTDDGALRLGYPIEFSDGTSVQSETGEVLPYSLYSLPWRGKPYTSIDTAPGVIYDGALKGIYGENAEWSLLNGVLTISGYGEGDSSYGFSNQPWSDYKDSIKEVYVEEGITKLSNGAFDGLAALEKVTLPEGLTEISSNTFSGCSSLKEITIPETVETIGVAAFSGCSALENLRLPSSLRTLENQAISFCTSLKEITLPPSLETVDGEVFRSSSALEAINTAEGSKYFTSVDGVLFNKEMTTLVAYPKGLETDFYAVPAGVETIGRYAFDTCNIGQLVISDTVTTLEDRSLSFIHGEKITVPRSVIEIGSDSLFSPEATIYVYRDSDVHKYLEANPVATYAFIPEIYAVDVREENGSVYVTVDAENVENAFVFAVGTKDGVLSSSGEVIYGNAVLSGDIDSVQVFCWESLESMIPICPSVTTML